MQKGGKEANEKEGSKVGRKRRKNEGNTREGKQGKYVANLFSLQDSTGCLFHRESHASWVGGQPPHPPKPTVLKLATSHAMILLS